MILTDASGLVLSRLDTGSELDRHLDSVQLAPGFSYAEESVGTNGIGTALEGGRPMHVFGHEHYAENLEDLACAGVPIRHPISGVTLGAVDLTCWRKDADPLLITLAKTTADQITQALLADSSAREFELLQEYLRACRRSAGIVLALNNDVVMMNDHARQVLDPADQVVLLAQAAEALASRHPVPVEVDLPTGAKARMYCRPVSGDDRLAGGVVHVKLVEPGAGRVAGETAPPKQQMFLPGLVGSGPLWLRACQQVDAVYTAGEWLALEGEPGAGQAGPAPGGAPAAESGRPLPRAGRRGRGGRRMAGDGPQRAARGHRHAWSSGTSTGSVPGGCTRCPPRSRRRWPRAGRSRSGSR